MEMHAFGRLVSMETALHRLLAEARPIGRTEPVPLGAAFDRVAASPVVAPVNVPSFARATWDGYAVRSADTARAAPTRPVELRLVGEVYAEGGYPGAVGPGEAVAIATGGAIPRRADAVAIFENVRRRSASIVLDRPVRPGDRIAPPGDDFARGARLLRGGESLAPAELGALAACGVGSVRCYARPVVAIVPNGNELLEPGEAPRRGSIYESNNVTLSSVILAAGGIPRPMRPVPDDPRRIERTVRAALREADLVLATGGSSVGERDHLPRVLPRLGRLLFHGIAVRPGKPTLAAVAGSKLVIGMPGHPSSCLANSFWLLLPVLRRIARRPGPGWYESAASLKGPALVPSPTFATVIPLGLSDGRARSTYHGSASITSMSGARGFVVLPPGHRTVRPGARLRVRWLLAPLGPTGAPGNG